MATREKETTVTIRVSADIKQRVESISREIGISQSAVWKILIARYMRPALEGDAERLILETITGSSRDTAATRTEPGAGLAPSRRT